MEHAPVIEAAEQGNVRAVFVCIPNATFVEASALFGHSRVRLPRKRLAESQSRDTVYLQRADILITLKHTYE